MNLAQEAFIRLYPNKINDYNFILKYNGKFKPYNGNVKISQSNVKFSLSKSWKKISKEIQIGMIQELLVKIFKDKKRTTEMELYSIFIKNVHISIPKTASDPLLEDSFTRLNESFFYGMMEKPNLKWGDSSIRRLGRYEYGSDTITISLIFKNADSELLDYVMYHEMLHKKLKFDCKNGRTYHHNSHFKELERAFPNSRKIEKEMSKLARTV